MRLLKLILLLSLSISSSLLVAQNADSTLNITINDNDTVVIYHTDTVIVAQDTTPRSGIFPPVPPLQQTSSDDKVDPASIWKTISVGKILWSIFFLILTYFAIGLASKLLNLIAERSTRYRITVKGLIPIIRILGWVFAIYAVVAGIISPPISTVVAVMASVGIAVGFAAQDILKNIFGGLMIIFDRPFKVGDKIEVGKYYGEVVEIGLRSTRVVTPDDSLVSVPNAEIMNQSVSNSNAGEPNCQVVAEIFLPITVDTDQVRKIALQAAQVSKYIYLNKPITVLFFNEVKERRSYLKMRLKAYVMDIRHEFNFKSDMTEIVLRELLSQKIINPEELY
jgi:small-conductance mechanosensitive channel